MKNVRFDFFFKFQRGSLVCKHLYGGSHFDMFNRLLWKGSDRFIVVRVLSDHHLSLDRWFLKYFSLEPMLGYDNVLIFTSLLSLLQAAEGAFVLVAAALHQFHEVLNAIFALTFYMHLEYRDDVIPTSGTWDCHTAPNFYHQGRSGHHLSRPFIKGKLYLSAKVTAFLLIIQSDAIFAEPDDLLSIFTWKDCLSHHTAKLVPAFSLHLISQNIIPWSSKADSTFTGVP